MIKKQKSCVKRIYLVTDDSLYDQKAFYEVKIFCYSSSIKWLLFFNYLKFHCKLVKIQGSFFFSCCKIVTNFWELFLCLITFFYLILSWLTSFNNSFAIFASHESLLILISMILGLIAPPKRVKECVNRGFSSMCSTNPDKALRTPSTNDLKVLPLNLGDLLSAETYSLAPFQNQYFLLAYISFYLSYQFSVVFLGVSFEHNTQNKDVHKWP